MPSRHEQRKMAGLAVAARQALATPLDEIKTTRPCVVCETELGLNTLACPDCGVPTKLDSRSQIRSSARCKDKSWMSTEVVERLSAITRSALAYNAEQRRKMAESGEALPDGSFPIGNCADAEAAIHAQGRATDQGKAVAHIKKRVGALGCSGTVFENYK